MQSGIFARSVVVKEWHARTCFISLPRSWASLTFPVATPTFSLEVSSGQTILLSWAGDMHNPDTGEESTVLINREILKDSRIHDGELGVITQVPVPPPCTSVTVTVGSLSQWQDLALNADVAQSAFLGQIRVMGLGQCLPLWLEGGAFVNLTVVKISPPLKFGILQPMTQVEVLPPTESHGSQSFAPINFNPTSIDGCNEEKEEESETEDALKNPNVVENEQQLTKLSTVPQTHEDSIDKKMFYTFSKHVVEELCKQRITFHPPSRTNICKGYRVHPLPVVKDSLLWGELSGHPSLVIVSRQSLLNVDYGNKVSFIAKLRKVDSPKEKSEKADIFRKSSKVSEVKKDDADYKTNMEVPDSRHCIVIVWENITKVNERDLLFVERIGSLMKGNNCIMPDVFRRLLKLSVSSVVEIETGSIDVKTVPVSLDVMPVVTIDDEKRSLLVENVCSKLRSLTDDFDVIIDQSTLLEVPFQGNATDVFLSVRDGIPLHLTKESVVLLKITVVSTISDLPLIPSTINKVDTQYHSKYPYVGNEELILKLRKHILLGLNLLTSDYDVDPHFAIVQGSKGTGKTSLVESLVEYLSSDPHYVHCDITNCKNLKGKKVETVEKKLQLIFREAIFKRPSVVILDDLDHLVPAGGIGNQEEGPAYDHIMQMVGMLRGLLDQLLEFCSEPLICHDDFPKRGTVVVVGTCISRTSIHPLLVNPQGCHYFPCTFGIPPWEPEERFQAFAAMLKARHKRYHNCQLSACQHKVRFAQDTERGGFREASRTDDDCHPLQLDSKIITRGTENFVLPDLHHLALRTFLQAKRRSECQEAKLSDSVVSERALDCIIRELSSRTAEDEDAAEEQCTILDCDVEAALKGYTPLALRGLALSEKKSNASLHVGGLTEARRALKEMLTWPSAFPNLFSKVNLRMRSGVLLYGPPGCGKTLIANSVAANCHLNFICVKGPELLSKYIGASEQAVRDAFERASSAKPCVLFFDEFESIAPRRGHDSTGVTDRVVNQLLTQMDGVEGLTGVYILAATSRPDLIDPALLRPGRLDKCVFCPMPNLSDREEILEVLSKDLDLGEEINWAEIASVTEHFTGADLQSLLSTAQVLVAQEALGDDLYKGIITSHDMKDVEIRNNPKGFSTSEEHKHFMKKSECDYSTNSAGQSVACDSSWQESAQEQVTIEKDKQKVFYSSSPKQRNEEKESTLDLESEEFTDTHITATQGLYVSNANHQSDLKVYERHIEEALLEVKPSVTPADRLRHEQLFTMFTKSRGGSFGKTSPGKRATQA